MQRIRFKYLSIIVALALGQTACDLDLAGIGEGFGEGLEHVDDFQMGPWPGGPGGPPLHAIRILVSPADSLTSSWVVPQDIDRVFPGTISDGSYVDSLRVQTWGYDYTQHLGLMVLVAGEHSHPSPPRARPGTYDVTIAAPGYITWDTTGVVVEADSIGVVRTVPLEVKLVELP
jgi:hypothetical protein